MRNAFLFPATLATVVATLPGAAMATSTTCSTSAVCSEYINTYTSSSPVSGGVAIRGESDGGIGIRGTSVSNVGFYGASGAGNYYVPGVEGESTNNNGNDAAGGFGLAPLVPGRQAPYLGIFAFGTSAGVQGETKAVGTSSSSAGYGIYGGDGRGTANASKGDYNAGVLGYSQLGTAVLAAAGSAPTAADFSEEPIGLYAVANQATGTIADGAVAVFGESDTDGLSLYHSTEGTNVYGAILSYLLYGIGNESEFYVDNNMCSSRLRATATASSSRRRARRDSWYASCTAVARRSHSNTASSPSRSMRTARASSRCPRRRFRKILRSSAARGGNESRRPCRSRTTSNAVSARKVTPKPSPL